MLKIYCTMFLFTFIAFYPIAGVTAYSVDSGHAPSTTAAPLTSRCTIGDSTSICGVFFSNYYGDYKHECSYMDFCQICHCRTGRWKKRHCPEVECELDGFQTLGKYGNSTYMLGPKQLTWVAAKQACIDAGGQLASIESDEEFEAIKSWFQGVPLKMGRIDWWIGGYTNGQRHLPMDYPSPRREYTTAYDLTPFHWLSGPEILFNNTRFAATRWLTTPYPKCLVLLPYPTNGRENWWFSLRCMQELLYLCEKSD